MVGTCETHKGQKFNAKLTQANVYWSNKSTYKLNWSFVHNFTLVGSLRKIYRGMISVVCKSLGKMLVHKMCS